MLDWLTFLASAVAAAGAILGPIVAYRSATRAMRREEDLARRDRHQERIDVSVQYALSENPVIAEMGVKQLLYLLQAGELTDDQKAAVVNAMEASLELATKALSTGPHSEAVTAPETGSSAAPAVRWMASEVADEEGDNP